MKFRVRHCRDLGILRKSLVFVEDFLIVRHKLLCLLFALNAGELEADFVRLKNTPHLGDEPG
jgi:hypothetical protein